MTGTSPVTSGLPSPSGSVGSIGSPEVAVSTTAMASRFEAAPALLDVEKLDAEDADADADEMADPTVPLLTLSRRRSTSAVFFPRVLSPRSASSRCRSLTVFLSNCERDSSTAETRLRLDDGMAACCCVANVARMLPRERRADSMTALRERFWRGWGSEI